MKKLFTALFLTITVMAGAQTNQTTFDQILAAAGLNQAPTNYAIEPYFTYAPKAKTKVGGGLLAAYNLNQHVALSLGLDWLGHFSLVSGNVTLQAPFHPWPTQYPNLVVTPFVLGGLATAYSGAGKFNGNASLVSDVGAMFKFGHLWKGQWNAGACYGQWSNVGPDYGGRRYHFFLGWAKGF